MVHRTNFPKLRGLLLALAIVSAQGITAVAQTGWERTGLDGLKVSGITFEPSTQALIAGTTTGIHRSTNFGASWSLVQADPLQNTSYWEFAFDGNGRVYGGNGDVSFAASTDGGATWRLDRDVISSFRRIRTVGVDGLGQVYVGTMQRVWRSSDRGSTFEDRSSGLPSGFPDIQAFAQNSTGSMLAGTGGIVGGHIFRSVDNGERWEMVHEGMLNNDITDIVAVPGGVLLAHAYALGILRSSDDGETWALANVYLGDSRVAAFAATDGAVWAVLDPLDVRVSSDAGVTWTTGIVEGLPNRPVSGVAAVPGRGLFAATDSGVYRLELPSASAPQESADMVNLVAWPVPARDELNVSVGGDVDRLEIVDVCGRVYARKNTEGQDRVVLALRHLADGQYFVRATGHSAQSAVRISVVR